MGLMAVSKSKRTTLDLDKEQHGFLKIFVLENGISASLLFREMVDQLEKDPELQKWVLDEIYAEG